MISTGIVVSSIFAYLLEKYGAALTFEEAASTLKYPSLAAAKSARQRGTFPISIRRAGDRHLCSAADVAAFLDGTEVPRSTRPRPGRPTKAEVMRREKKKAQIAAAAAGAHGRLV
jgi:hypothetical protein